MTLEYDSWLEMWYAAVTTSDGKLHRKWFTTEAAAKKWLDYWANK